MDDDRSEDEPILVPVPGAVALLVIFEFKYLPYFPTHVAFMEHARAEGGCPQCHLSVWRPEELDPDLEDEDLFCSEGLVLKEAALAAVVGQHEQALQN